MVNAAANPAALHGTAPAALAATARRLWLHGDGPLSGLLAEALCAAEIGALPGVSEVVAEDRAPPSAASEAPIMKVKR